MYCTHHSFFRLSQSLNTHRTSVSAANVIHNLDTSNTKVGSNTGTKNPEQYRQLKYPTLISDAKHSCPVTRPLWSFPDKSTLNVPLHAYSQHNSISVTLYAAHSSNVSLTAAAAASDVNIGVRY